MPVAVILYSCNPSVTNGITSATPPIVTDIVGVPSILVTSNCILYVVAETLIILVGRVIELVNGNIPFGAPVKVKSLVPSDQPDPNVQLYPAPGTLSTKLVIR